MVDKVALMLLQVASIQTPDGEIEPSHFHCSGVQCKRKSRVHSPQGGLTKVPNMPCGGVIMYGRLVVLDGHSGSSTLSSTG